MAEIFRTRDHDPYGDIRFGVGWQDNDGVVRERYFESRRAAERFALTVEVVLLNETIQSLTFAGPTNSP